MEFIWIPAAQVYVQTTEVTVAQMMPYSRRLATRGGWLPKQRRYSVDWPALNISGRHGTRFAKWLSQKVRKHDFPQNYVFRLPTEDEWVLVASEGEERKFPWGNAWPPEPMSDGNLPNLRGKDLFHGDKLWYDISSFMGPHAAGIVIPEYWDGYPGPCSVYESGMNQSGIFGLAGNVSEWVWESASNNYVLKGGAFNSMNKDQLEIKNRVYPGRDIWTGELMTYNYGTGIRLIFGPQMN